MGRFFYVTPTSYLELIGTFRALLNSQRTEVSDIGKPHFCTKFTRGFG